jgi:UDP-N-acetylglucosamine--N-acetylmuramyl-(pentapeptide) pyrophosphoryl-undecaprenol N-acetylglucosamine transferase
MKILMTGGGTGGHVNPALAIANTIKQNIPDAEIAFVGTNRGIENTLVPKAGYKLYHINVRGFWRKITWKNIRAAYLAAVSPIRAGKLIKSFKPDAVIGTGGYTCWPVLMAAAKRGIPTAVHESNAVPGLAVRKLSAHVDRVFVNFAVTAEHLDHPEKVMHVGCPLLNVSDAVGRTEARAKLEIPQSCRHYILSFGGSLGASRMNAAALELTRDVIAKRPEIMLIHSCGSLGYEETREAFEKAGLLDLPNLRLVEYIYDMPLQMAAADLVICRAGAITLSEIANQGKASILIPSPNVTDDQQYKNAKVLSDGNGAILIRESELEEGRIGREVEKLICEPYRLEEMRRNVKKFAAEDANTVIFDEVMRLIKEREVAQKPDV